MTLPSSVPSSKPHALPHRLEQFRSDLITTLEAEPHGGELTTALIELLADDVVDIAHESVDGRLHFRGQPND